MTATGTTDLPLFVETLEATDASARDTFLLLHGYAGSSFSWRYWVPYLRTRGRVLLVDMKGFGRAPRPADGRYSPADQADLVMALIREQRLDRLTLMGHSLGGGVVLYVTRLMAEAGLTHRLHRLVIVAGAAYPQRLPPFVALASRPRLTGLLLRLAGMRLVVSQALRTMVYDPGNITGDQIRGYAAPLGAPGSLLALRDSALQIIPPDLEALTRSYATITAPTLLLWGRQDPAVPLWVGERLHRDIPGSALAVLERCGHLPAEEKPGESLAVLRDFLEGGAAPSPSAKTR